MKSGIAATGTRPALSSGAASSAALAEKRSEEQAAAVAHEDRRRPHVVDEEPERRADEGGDRQRSGVEPDADSAASRKMPGDGRDARRQSVDVVEQVEGVGDADHPHQREQRVDDDDAGDVARPASGRRRRRR